MNKLHDHFSHTARTLRMTHEEKRLMWARIAAHTRGRSIASPYAYLISLRTVTAFLLILLVGGGSAFAAESSLPGSAFYPLKVSVLEPLREAVLETDEEKAAWQAQVLARRVEEAQALAAQGAFSKDAELALENELSKRTQKRILLAQKIEERDPETAERLAAEFDSALAAHTEILERLAGRSGDRDTSTASLALASRLREGSYPFWTTVVEEPSASALRVEDTGENAGTALMKEEAEDADAPRATAMLTAATPAPASDVPAPYGLTKRIGELLENTKETYEDVADLLEDSEQERIALAIEALEERTTSGEDALTARTTLQELTRLYTFMRAAERLNDRTLLEPFFERNVRGASTDRGNEGRGRNHR